MGLGDKVAGCSIFIFISIWPFCTFHLGLIDFIGDKGRWANSPFGAMIPTARHLHIQQGRGSLEGVEKALLYVL